MEEFKAGFPAFYEATKAGTLASGNCLYYGFAVEGNTVFCREVRVGMCASECALECACLVCSYTHTHTHTHTHTQGYTSADGVLAHLDEVKEPLDAALKADPLKSPLCVYSTHVYACIH